MGSGLPRPTGRASWRLAAGRLRCPRPGAGPDSWWPPGSEGWHSAAQRLRGPWPGPQMGTSGSAPGSRNAVPPRVPRPPRLRRCSSRGWATPGWGATPWAPGSPAACTQSGSSREAPWLAAPEPRRGPRTQRRRSPAATASAQRRLGAEARGTEAVARMHHRRRPFAAAWTTGARGARRRAGSDPAPASRRRLRPCRQAPWRRGPGMGGAARAAAALVRLQRGRGVKVERARSPWAGGLQGSQASRGTRAASTAAARRPWRCQGSAAQGWRAPGRAAAAAWRPRARPRPRRA
mmetsp:Transcript_10201/g.31447  ORF Transcript_10201/g.31447 Transcript_10201/m.31447 type:complete len:292 (-) Transcript_10201:134-1009(-)